MRETAAVADGDAPATALSDQGRAHGRGTLFDYDRTVALSDGVFAIALTLLVLNIPQPSAEGDLWSALGDLLPDLGSYALSFVVIAGLWRNHHIFFRGLTRIDARLTSLNLFYLGMIALIPFPTALLANRGDEAPAVIVYAATIALATALGGAMRVYARRHRMAAPDGRTAFELIAVPGVFVISMPIALLDPTAAELSWLSLILVGRIAKRRRG